MSDLATTTTTAAPSPATASGRPVTSANLRRIAKEMRSGRQPLVTGSIDDLVLLSGQPLELSEAIEALALPSFDVVLRINGVDLVLVVKGEDLIQGLQATPSPAPGPADTDREARLRQLRARTGRAGEEDPVTLLRRCLTQTDFSVFALVEQADILLQDPAHHDRLDRDRVAALQMALRHAARVGTFRNTCVLLAGERESIPSVLVAGCQDIAQLSLSAPSRTERLAFIQGALPRMHDGDTLAQAWPDRADRVVEDLATLTDGETLRTLDSLAAFSAAARLSVVEPRSLVYAHRVGDRIDYCTHLLPQLQNIVSLLRSRVFGQPWAVERVVMVLAASALGLDLSGNRMASEGRPRGVLWFDGPTGVGKTELAKAVAEALFGDSEAYFRLDMSTFGQEHSADRLCGAPPGYVGYEQGGELTNAVMRRPHLVILLDEIEKAHPRVWDRLLSIFDDGRITDAQGRVAYFSDAIFILTSNIGGAAVASLFEETGGEVGYDLVARASRQAVQKYFVDINRRELFGRIEPGLVAFDILRPEMVEPILGRLVDSTSFARGPRLEVDLASAREMALLHLADPESRILGGRQVRNTWEQAMRSLAAWLALTGRADASRVRITFQGREMWASLDGAEPVPVKL